MTLLIPHVVLALIFGATSEVLNSLAVLMIVSPISFIPGTLLGCVYAKAIGLIIYPIPVVNVPTGMVKFSATTRLVIIPTAIVLA